LHTTKNEVVILGEINVNCFADNRKTCLNSLLLSCNLSGIVISPTGIENNSVSAIDNIFLHNSRKVCLIMKPDS
jgi:hypothetical protein